jgi:hypothetical protein
LQTRRELDCARRLLRTVDTDDDIHHVSDGSPYNKHRAWRSTHDTSGNTTCQEAANRAVSAPTRHDHVGASALGGAKDRGGRGAILDTNPHIRPPAHESFRGDLGGRSDSLLKHTLEGVPLLVSPSFA